MDVKQRVETPLSTTAWRIWTRRMRHILNHEWIFGFTFYYQIKKQSDSHDQSLYISHSRACEVIMPTDWLTGLAQTALYIHTCVMSSDSGCCWPNYESPLPLVLHDMYIAVQKSSKHSSASFKHHTWPTILSSNNVFVVSYKLSAF